MSPADVALLSAVVLGFGLVSKRLEGTILTPPMVFVLIGVIVGPGGLGLLDLEVGEGALHVLAELTLILVLFADATRIDLAALRREVGLPVRLLGIGLPLSMVAGAGLAVVLLPELSLFEAAALGAILAPTDAALGQAVVSSPAVPLRIRQALNVESGLNDGIALPFVLIFVSLASMGHGETRSAEAWALFAALQVTVGPVMGWAVAWASGRLLAWARGHIEESFERLAGPAIALLCFGAAELAGGNGFIAAFVGGVTLGHTQRHHCRWTLAFLEAEGQLLTLIVFLGLGSTFALEALAGATPAVVGYALLSLTVVRMLPVALSLVGTGLQGPSYLFLGWFGPRGLASVLYGILVLADGAAPHEDLIFNVVVVTALLSVLLHGVTAAPGAARYGASMGSAKMESMPVTEHPTR